MSDKLHVTYHERLCPRSESALSICCCDVVRKAYRQGREDASLAIWRLRVKPHHDPGNTYPCLDANEALWAAIGAEDVQED